MRRQTDAGPAATAPVSMGIDFVDVDGRPMTRERRAGPRLTVIYWRDIPAQVKVRAGRERFSAPLPDRFMTAVDGAATVAGKTKADEYIAEWREETRPCDNDLETAANAEVKLLDEAYPPDLLRSYVRNGGWAPADD